MSIHIFYAALSAIMLGLHNALVPRVIDEGFSKRSFIFYKELFTSGTLFLIMIIMYIFADAKVLFSWKGFLFGMLTGILGYLVLELFYFALGIGKKGPVSAITYAYMAPFVLLGLFFSKTHIEVFGKFSVLNGETYGGIMMITMGIVGISLLGRGDDANKKSQKSIYLAIVAMCIYAVMMLFMGSLKELLGIWFGSFMGRIGLIGTSSLVKMRRPKDFQRPSRSKLFWSALLGVMTAIVMLTAVMALSGEKKEVPAAVYGSSPMITWLVTLVFFDKDKEESKVTLGQVIGVFLTIGGIITISLYYG